MTEPERLEMLRTFRRAEVARAEALHLRLWGFDYAPPKYRLGQRLYDRHDGHYGAGWVVVLALRLVPKVGENDDGELFIEACEWEYDTARPSGSHWGWVPERQLLHNDPDSAPLCDVSEALLDGEEVAAVMAQRE